VNFFNILGAAAFLHGTGWILERAAGPAGLRGPEQYRTAFLAVAAAVGVALALYALTRDARVGARAPGAGGPDRGAATTGPRPRHSFLPGTSSLSELHVAGAPGARQDGSSRPAQEAQDEDPPDRRHPR
jgi:hypothetical protein